MFGDGSYYIWLLWVWVGCTAPPYIKSLPMMGAGFHKCSLLSIFKSPISLPTSLCPAFYKCMKRLVTLSASSEADETLYERCEVLLTVLGPMP